ncbi:unnamed protein product, partial [Closterium sp. NIES-53]
GCAVPQLPTFTATRASAGVSISEDNAPASAADMQKQGKGGKKGGRGVASVKEAAVVEAALGAAAVVVVVVPHAEGALEEVLTRLLEEVQPAVVRGPSSSSHSSNSHSRDSSSSSSRDSSSGKHHSSFSHGDPYCCGVRSSTGALCHNGDREDPGALAASLCLRPRRPLCSAVLPPPRRPLPCTLGSSGLACWPVRFFVDLCLSSLGACVSALGASVASGPDTPPAEASLSITLDSGVSQSVARSSTTLPCPVVPSGVLRGLHIPSFTRNLVGVGYLQDNGITVTFVGGGRIAFCADAATGAVLAREPRSGLYVLHTECSPVTSLAHVVASPQVPVSSQVAVSGQAVVSGQVAASCSYRSLTHPTVLWHRRLGHLSLPCLRSMASHSRVSSLPHVFPLIHAHAPHFFVGSAFHVWGCLALVRDTSADKLSALGSALVFLGFLVGSPDHSFYHSPLHQFLDSRDVRFDESVSFYIRYPYGGLPVPPPSLFLAPSPPPAPTPPVPPPPPCPSPSDTGGTWSGGARSRGARAGGAGAGGASSGGAGAGGFGTGGASSGGTRAWGAGTGGSSSGGAGARGTGSGGASSGGAGAGGVDTEETGVGGSPTALPTTREAGAAAVGAAAAAARAAAAVAAAADAAAATFVAAVPSSEWPSGPWSSSPPVHSQSPTAYCPTFPPPDSTSAVFSPPQSRSSPPVVPHDWTIISHCSSHPIADYYHAARPIVSRVLASLVTDPRASPSFVSALTAAVADFASTRQLDYAMPVVAAPPPLPLSVGGEWASQWKAAMDAELASWRSTGTYVDAIPPPRANVVDGMWLFKVKRSPGSPPVFKARYVARGFSQREGVEFFQTFVPTPKMTTLRV